MTVPYSDFLSSSALTATGHKRMRAKTAKKARDIEPRRLRLCLLVGRRAERGIMMKREREKVREKRCMSERNPDGRNGDFISLAFKNNNKLNLTRQLPFWVMGTWHSVSLWARWRRINASGRFVGSKLFDHVSSPTDTSSFFFAYEFSRGYLSHARSSNVHTDKTSRARHLPDKTSRNLPTGRMYEMAESRCGLHGLESISSDLPFPFEFDSWTDLDLNFCGSASIRPSCMEMPMVTYRSIPLAKAVISLRDDVTLRCGRSVRCMDLSCW